MSDINGYILDFVNSKDIRKHLEEIGYQFNASEAAWLIWQSRNSTLEERHLGWRRIIAEYSDCPIPERMNTIPQPSLRRFLEEYMDMENRVLERFRDSEGAVYQVEYRFSCSEPVKENRVYSRFEPEKMNFVMDDEENAVQSFLCIRLPVNGMDENALGMSFSVRLDTQMRIMAVDLDPGLLVEQDRRLLMDVFPGFWFDLPTPFRKGDILWNPNRQGGHFGGPFVCISINHHGLADEKHFEYLRREADTTDMQVNGLFANGKYGVYEDCMSDYMDCEYYPKEVVGFQRLLTPFSAYEKGEIDEELLVRACRHIMLDTEMSFSGLNWYPLHMLKKAGIG